MPSLLKKVKNLLWPPKESDALPATVESAVDQILSELSDFNRNRISNMNEDRLRMFHQDFGFYIMNRFRLWTNESLKQSCCELAGVSRVTTDQASYIILQELRNRIRQADDKGFKI
jgi:hypothetical protein